MPLSVTARLPCPSGTASVYFSPLPRLEPMTNSTHHDDTEHLDVRYVAHLARIVLTDEEVETFQGQLDDILSYVNQLKALDVEGIEPTAHAVPSQNVFREDQTRPCLDHDQVMGNAPSVWHGEFEVPAIIE